MTELAALLDMPDLPEGSAIRVLHGRHGVRLRWPRPGRLSGIAFVAFVGVVLLLFAGILLADHEGRKDLIPWLLIPAVALGGVCALCFWLGGSGRSTIALEPDRLVFYAPARRSILQAILSMSRLRATGYAPPDIQDRAEWEAEVEAQRRRRRHMVARSPDVPVEDLGGLRGVSVGAIRFGQDLDSADHEWLVSVLRRWKDMSA